MEPMKHISILSLCFFFILTLGAQAQELLKVQAFHSIATGRGGIKTPTYLKFEEQLNRGRKARGVFRKCLKKGTPAAKLYGALGLYHLNKPEGEQALTSLLGNQDPLPILRGCIISETTVGALSKDFLDGTGKLVTFRMFLPN